MPCNKRKVSFLARGNVTERITLDTRDGPKSFMTSRPSKRRNQVTFKARK